MNSMDIAVTLPEYASLTMISILFQLVEMIKLLWYGPVTSITMVLPTMKAKKSTIKISATKNPQLLAMTTMTMVIMTMIVVKVMMKSKMIKVVVAMTITERWR